MKQTHKIKHNYVHKNHTIKKCVKYFGIFNLQCVLCSTHSTKLKLVNIEILVQYIFKIPQIHFQNYSAITMIFVL